MIPRRRIKPGVNLNIRRSNKTTETLVTPKVEKGESENATKLEPDTKPAAIEPPKIAESKVDQFQEPPSPKTMPEFSVPSPSSVGASSPMKQTSPAAKRTPEYSMPSPYRSGPSSPVRVYPPSPSIRNTDQLPGGKVRQRIKQPPSMTGRRFSNTASESESGDEIPPVLKEKAVNSIPSSPVASPLSYNSLMSPPPPQVYRTSKPRTESTSSHVSDVPSHHEKARKISRTEEIHRAAGEKRNGLRFNGALKMADLIYYNPSTNPMTKIPSKNKVRIIDDISLDAKMPEKTTTEQEPMAVPQIKLGLNNEIILDDTSLVIETTHEKVAREALLESEVIYHDETTGSGFYKKHQRAKEWTISDTLKFYKCLNTVGTDFSLMVLLLPERSRRDLKLKYKREERINEPLIRKALLNPKAFDIEELKKTFDETDEIEKAKGIHKKYAGRLKAASKKKKKSPRKSKSNRRQSTNGINESLNIEETEDSIMELNETPNDNVQEKKPNVKALLNKTIKNKQKQKEIEKKNSLKSNTKRKTTTNSKKKSTHNEKTNDNTGLEQTPNEKLPGEKGDGDTMLKKSNKRKPQRKQNKNPTKKKKKSKVDETNEKTDDQTIEPPVNESIIETSDKVLLETMTQLEEGIINSNNNETQLHDENTESVIHYYFEADNNDPENNSTIKLYDLDSQQTILSEPNPETTAFSNIKSEPQHQPVPLVTNSPSTMITEETEQESFTSTEPILTAVTNVADPLELESEESTSEEPNYSLHVFGNVDPLNSSNIRFEVFVKDPDTGELMNEPLDLPPDVLQQIVDSNRDNIIIR